MLSYAEARRVLIAHFAARAAPTEALALDAAYGRVLASDLVTERAVPGFVHAAMDGFAVRAVDLHAGTPTLLDVVATVYAGGDAARVLEAGTCARVMTGAALPAGADTVVMREHAVEHPPKRVEVVPGTARGANVRGADDELAAGALALGAGTLLGAGELGLAAALGCAQVTVRVRPRVTLLISGDELLPAGASWRHGMRYDSNGPMLRAILHELGLELLACERVADDADAVRDALARAAAASDIVLSTGGVSAGDADYFARAVREQGSVFFWKVAIRPGMPILFGSIGATPVLALPGNAVSAYAMCVALLRPALAAWLRCPSLDPAPVAARLASPIEKRHARFELRRASLSVTHDAMLEVSAHPKLSSGALSSVAASDALVLLDAGVRDYAAGTILPVLRLPDAFR
jgi:molybdopterin molybdotransferase